MRYSENWQYDINNFETNYMVDTGWETISEKYGLTPESGAYVLSRGVWLKMPGMCDYFKYRKARAMKNGGLYYECSYKGLYVALYSSLPGVISIDGHELNLKDAPKYPQDLYKAKNPEYQNKLLAFIRKYAGISDKNLPQIPDGIIKLPDSML